MNKERLDRRRAAVIAVVITLAVGLSVLIFLDGDSSPEKGKKWVIDGGAVGDDVHKIEAGERIEVVENEGGEKWVEIKDGKIEPEELQTELNSQIYFKNLDSRGYMINFLGLRKSTSLEFNQSYLLRFESPGTYRYRVNNNTWSVEGEVVVED